MHNWQATERGIPLARRLVWGHAFRMSNKTIVPCIWLDDQAEDAGRLYCETFRNSRVTATTHYPQTADNPSGKPRGSVLTVEVDLAGQPFTLLNGGPQFEPNPSISFYVQLETAEEVDRVAKALGEGGALMAVDSYPWSKRYGWVRDRFGVTWQVMVVDEKPRETILPCVMFVGAQAGRAADAMKLYTTAFEGGHVDAVERYAEGEGTTSHLKHGRCTLAGQTLVVMDSDGPHDFGFDEGVSLQVLCDDQKAIDHYWAALVEGGGQHGPCGWLKDRFGVSWQVAPRAMERWLTASDAAARDRAFGAMLKMSKIDIAALEAAFEGR